MSVALTYGGQQYTCEKALKGSNYVHLLDANGNLITAFDGVADFEAFTLTSGEWESAPSPTTGALATIGDDNKLIKGAYTCSDIAKAQANIVTFKLGYERSLVSKGSYSVNVLPFNTSAYNKKIPVSGTFYEVIDNSDGNNGGYILRILKPGYILLNYSLTFKSSTVDDTEVTSFAKRSVSITTDNNNPSDANPLQRQTFASQLTISSNDGTNSVYYTTSLPSTLIKITDTCDINPVLEGIVSSEYALKLMRHSYLTFQFFEV